MLVSLLVFIVMLSVLVFVHELGHFLVAKWSGMQVDEFAIGFPPRIFARKRGETVYAINALPLGGYVKINGENPDLDNKNPRAFQNRPIWLRIPVIVAGVIMNLLFAFIVLSIAFTTGFPSTGIAIDQLPGAKITGGQISIAQVISGSPAEAAKLRMGDVIITVKDQKTGTVTAINSVEQLQNQTKVLQKVGDLQVSVQVERNGENMDIPATLNASGPGLGIQIQSDSTPTVRVPWYRAPQAAVLEMRDIIVSTWDSLRDFASQLFIHAHLDQDVSGPVGIYQATAAATQAGPVPVIFLVVVLSINLALLNILPIPALDGGRLFFLVLELIFGKRVMTERVEGIITTAGFSLLLLLIAIITIKDIARLF